MKIFEQKVLITGGAGFLGNFMCELLLSQGLLVVSLDNNKKEIIKQKDKLTCFDRFHNFYTDITNKKELLKLYKILSLKKILPDVIINNAAIDAVPKNKESYDQINLSSWKKEIDVSLLGSLLIINIFAEHMIKNQYGKIINIGSDLSVIAPNQNIYKGVFKNYTKPATYSIIKHGLLGMTKYYASLYGKYNISTNMLSPGPILRDHPIKFIKNLKNIIPANKMNSFDKLRTSILFLIDPGSNYLNGQNIVVDGGRTII
jgi:NAD(P)-dependent dehydrogenase (short-subunit alcohol dehydrogenase family)